MPRFGKRSNIRRYRDAIQDAYKKQVDKKNPKKQLPLEKLKSIHHNQEWLAIRNPLGNPTIKSKSSTDVAWLIWVMKHRLAKNMVMKILFYSEGLVEWMFGCYRTIDATLFTCHLWACYTGDKCEKREIKCKYCRYKAFNLTIQN